MEIKMTSTAWVIHWYQKERKNLICSISQNDWNQNEGRFVVLLNVCVCFILYVIKS